MTQSEFDIAIVTGKTEFENEYLDRIKINNNEYYRFRFNNCVFYGVDAKFANLIDTVFTECEFITSSFSHADLDESTFSRCKIDNCNFMYTRFACCRVKHTHLLNCKFANADLSNTVFHASTLLNVKFGGIDLSSTKFDVTGLVNSDISGCNMPPPHAYLTSMFEYTDRGLIAYKVFDKFHAVPEYWHIEDGAWLHETCNYDRSVMCGCGINLATKKWIQFNFNDTRAWKVLIPNECLCDVCVPLHTDGVIRTSTCVLLEEVDIYD